MLYVVATPIGDTQEISLRALEILKQTQNIICESTKETSKLLKQHGISGKTYHVLDEHSQEEDLKALLEICQKQDAALVSDCGTPVFCDPGSRLIMLCREKNIPIRSVLGASSLMGLLSLSSQKITQFVFRGFISAETEQRQRDLIELKKEKRAIVLMDTPYRLKKMMDELKTHFPKRKALLVLDLSMESELILEDYIERLALALPADRKAEFMILIYAEKS